jgi:hypothetical protein
MIISQDINLSFWFYAWQKADPKFSIKDFKKEDTNVLLGSLTSGEDKFYYSGDEIVEKWEYIPLIELKL